jgi:hypothetical protein
VCHSGQTAHSGRVNLLKGQIFRGLQLRLPEANMAILAKSGIETLLVLLATSSAVFAQNNAPEQPQNHGSGMDARQIVALSIAATERSWQARDHYIYLERDQDQRLDSLGHVKSETVDVNKIILVHGAHFEQLIERNGQHPSAADQKKSNDDLDKLKHESADGQAARLRKDQDNRAFLRDVIEAFDFRLIGEEVIDGRPAYVLQATPHPGYRAHGKYGKFLSNVEGKLWIDKKDFGWIKVDGQVTQSFSIGLLIARVQRGSHIIFEQMCIGDAVWVPKRLELRASARILFVKTLDIARILTYSEYRPSADSSYSETR